MEGRQAELCAPKYGENREISDKIWTAEEVEEQSMVHVAPGSRSPFWSQNQVKVLIDRESSFHISSTQTSSQIIFLKFDSVCPPGIDVVTLSGLKSDIGCINL